MRAAARIAVAVAVCWCAGDAGAATLTVRSGEHAGFSRLVIDAPGETGWVFGRIAGGYRLELRGEDFTFETGDVFRLIPRTRLKALGQVAGGLDLEVDDRSHALAFETEGGALVIDIADGPPEAGSRFEEPISETAPKAGSTPETAPDSDDGSSPTAAGPQPSVTSAPIADGRFFAVPDPDRAPGLASSSIAARLPDPRIIRARSRLLEQIGRAASQGLIEPAERPPAEDRAGSGHFLVEESGENPISHDLTQSPTPAWADSLPPDNREERMPLRVETSIDRDAVLADEAPEAAGQEECPPPETFAIGHWADKTPLSDQLPSARSALVGEFDIADPGAVVALARLYLHFGFGAEATAVLRAFPPPPVDADILEDMAAIVDHATPSWRSRLKDLGGCGPDAALWSALATPSGGAATSLERAAVLRSFSGLPPHLRALLGPDLAQRFLASRDTSAARAVRDAMARVPDGDETPTEIVSAQIDTADGKPDAAEAALSDLVGQGGSAGVAALVSLIASQAGRGQPVSEPHADLAAALAFEYRGSKLGAELFRAHLQALASRDAFEAAFDELARAIRDGDGSVPEESFAALVRPFLGLQDDGRFLMTMFSHKELLRHAPLDPDIRLALADRAAALGFAGIARDFLDGYHGSGAAATIARIALIEGDGTRATAALDGDESPQARRLKAEALALSGDHRGAADEYRALGDPEAARQQAWRSGDWSAVPDLAGSADYAALLGAPEDEPAPAQILQSDRRKVEDSVATRDALARLLERFSLPSR